MRVFESSHGYEPDENGLVEADHERGVRASRALTAAGVPLVLAEFYERVEEVSLPDVKNGFFLHAADQVIDGLNGGQPTEVEGALSDSIVVFGSDGGGGLFATSVASGQVYRLNGGSLLGPVYDVDASGVEVIAVDFWGFLEYLRQELLQAISDGAA